MTLGVHDLSVGRGDVQVLTGVGFTCAPGSALVLRGPNGSGKTTLLRTLAGLTPPIAGRIEAAPEAIAYAGHSDGIKAQMTVAENLTFWARIAGHRDIATALDAFDLGSLSERRAGELSAGQKRRLSLARLMVTGRPIWCLDEPTVSLDTENTARFARAIAGHLGRGGIAIVATHIDLGIGGETLDVSRFAAQSLRPDDPFAGDWSA
ncbi:heme ABC exporter ATP-binding protein CcmA [Rhodobacterales bacterium HKCCE3408]|nr:heme ABC exporter ATP-binding protein CcmA [Rhodobacterales bacterium HKCCE3408]